MESGKRQSRHSGFTLIELMVVIVIFGILASLAVARYMNAKDRGYVAAAAYDLDLVRKMLAFYSIDWNSYPSAVGSYEDLQASLVDSDGNSYGRLPHNETFSFLSYELDDEGDYVVRVAATDNPHTILVATPETIVRE